MMERTPTDGQPFYCKSCGFGWGEVMACEDGPCEMESQFEAETRMKPIRRKRKADTTPGSS